MKSEFALAFGQTCAEYNLSKEVVSDAIEAALVSAYRRDWKVALDQNVAAEINTHTGQAQIFIEKHVVAEVENAETEISLAAARGSYPEIELGTTCMIPVTSDNFGRIAAQTAKQVIMQRLKEAERESQYSRIIRQEGEIVIGSIQSIHPQGVAMHLEGREEARLPRREQIPGEYYPLHKKIRVYVLSVQRSPRGLQILVSRSHPAMLLRLLEIEVPEIRSGQIEIKAIAREAGTRSKVAVLGHQEGLDPVGACVGIRGSRVQNISRELNGERVDIIKWAEGQTQFIKNALSLDGILSVVLDENRAEGRTASVVVADEQLSLAIGRSGQNARLSAKITGWRVDIQGVTGAALSALQAINNRPDLLDGHKEIVGLVPRLANIIQDHDKNRYPYTDEERRIIKTVLEVTHRAFIERRDRARPGAQQEEARLAAQREDQSAQQAAAHEALATVPPAAYEAGLHILDLSDRVIAHLAEGGLQNVGEVMGKMAQGDEALLILDGVGAKALVQIKKAVKASPYAFVGSEVEPEVVSEERIAPEAPVEVAAPEPVMEEPEPAVVPAVEPAEVTEAVEEAAAEAPEEPMVEESEIPSSEEQIIKFDSAAIKALQAALSASKEKLRKKKPRRSKSSLPVSKEEVEFNKQQGRKHQGNKNALVYNEETGETYAMRRKNQDGTYETWEDRQAED
ncbi:MAG: transcription termination factor NusA [Chloroflexota bacterium]|nr:transcription termination factor NusA [Chloroflexota bacterium]